MDVKMGRQQMRGAQVASMLDHRPTACVRNHSMDNMKAIREKERKMRMQRGMEALKMPEKQFKLKQFDNVPSRAFSSRPPLPGGGYPAPADKAQRRVLQMDAPGSTGAVRRSASSPPPQIDQDDDDEENIMSMAAFDAEVEKLKQMHGGEKQKGAKIEKDAVGRPKYLQRIKADLAHEKREAEERRRGPEVPAGYRIMPQEEVEETMEALKKKREALEKEFQRLPFKIETESQKAREKRVLDDIKQTEDAMKLFSRPKVIVEA